MPETRWNTLFTCVASFNPNIMTSILLVSLFSFVIYQLFLPHTPYPKYISFHWFVGETGSFVRTSHILDLADFFSSWFHLTYSFIIFISYKLIVRSSGLFKIRFRFFFFFLTKNTFFFWLNCVACRILVPWPGIKPRPPVLGVWKLSHWTTREVLTCPFSMSESLFQHLFIKNVYWV